MEENNMSLGINSISSNNTTIQNTNTDKKTKEAEVSEEKKEEEIIDTYEKGNNTNTGIYSKNKMSETDRAALAEQLKSDMETRKAQLINIINKSIFGQADAFGKATGDESIWKKLSSGNFSFDPATKAQAKKDIAEDGYWGVKQTSQRLFDFASALAGDDVDKMKQMQAAMEKGFKMATKTWGKELPSICSETMSAANKLFEDYYKSKEVASE